MPIDPKQALEYLGVNPEEIETFDQFKEHVGKTYVLRSNAHLEDDIVNAALGKTYGSLRTKLSSAAKELGLNVDFSALKPAEGIELLAAGAKATLGKFQEELNEAKKGGKTGGKEIEEIQRKYEEATKKVEALTGNLTEWEQKYNNLESTVKQRERDARIEAQWERAISGLKFNEGISPLAIKGFQAEVRSRYAVDFDDEGKPYAVDALSKKRVPNPNKAHDFLGLDDLVKAYAEQEKLIGGPPNNGKPIRQTTSLFAGAAPAPVQQQAVQGGGAAPVRRTVMPPVQ